MKWGESKLVGEEARVKVKCQGRSFQERSSHIQGRNLGNRVLLCLRVQGLDGKVGILQGLPFTRPPWGLVYNQSHLLFL